MIPLAIDFDNLHAILRNLYQEMTPLCSDMIGVSKGIAGLGALFYVAYRVWQALSRAEPIDVFPLLRPFAIGLCILFFPTMVLGTVNAVMSPVVRGTHAILERQITDTESLRMEKERLRYQERVRQGEAWMVDKEAWDEKLDDAGISNTRIAGMWAERQWYKIKTWFQKLILNFFELLYHAAALTIDTLRTFFLVALSILGPLSFALSVYDGFHATLTHWLSKYISVYLWLPVSDLFSAVLSKVQALMLTRDIARLQDPAFVPDGAGGMYIVFFIIGIIGYFSIPTVAGWIVQTGGGSATRGANLFATKSGAIAGALAGAAAGNIKGRLKRRRSSNEED
jgi:conjugative transposon TraJ protein